MSCRKKGLDLGGVITGVELFPTFLFRLRQTGSAERMTCFYCGGSGGGRDRWFLSMIDVSSTQHAAGARVFHQETSEVRLHL